MSSLLALVVACSIQAESVEPLQADFSAMVVEFAAAFDLETSAAQIPEPGLTVCDVAYYYDDLAPLALRSSPVMITYDWRSPVFFDLP